MIGSEVKMQKYSNHLYLLDGFHRDFIGVNAEHDVLFLEINVTLKAIPNLNVGICIFNSTLACSDGEDAANGWQPTSNITIDLWLIVRWSVINAGVGNRVRGDSAAVCVVVEANTGIAEAVWFELRLRRNLDVRVNIVCRISAGFLILSGFRSDAVFLLFLAKWCCVDCVRNLSCMESDATFKGWSNGIKQIQSLWYQNVAFNLCSD